MSVACSVKSRHSSARLRVTAKPIEKYELVAKER